MLHSLLPLTWKLTRLSSPRAVLPILQLIKAHGENLYRERFKLYQCFGTMAVIHSLNKIHLAVANPHISMSQSSTIPFLFVVFVSFFPPQSINSYICKFRFAARKQSDLENRSTILKWAQVDPNKNCMLWKQGLSADVSFPQLLLAFKATCVISVS